MTNLIFLKIISFFKETVPCSYKAQLCVLFRGDFEDMFVYQEQRFVVVIITTVCWFAHAQKNCSLNSLDIQKCSLSLMVALAKRRSLKIPLKTGNAFNFQNLY